MARAHTKNLDVSIGYTCNFLYFTSIIIHIKLTLLNPHELIANGIRKMLNFKDTTILVKLAIPLILSGLVQASLGFTSTLFLSHLGTESLAAGSLVSWFFATLMVVFWGIFTSVSVLVSNYRGAGEDNKITYVLRDGLYLAIVLSLPLSVLVWNMGPILYALGQKKELVQMTIPYLHALSFGLLPDLVGLLLLQFVVGLEHMKTNLIFNISWVILNIVLNYAFIYGYFGLPALGIAGLGWGNTCSYWITTLAWGTYFLMQPHYRGYFQTIFKPSKPFYFYDLLKIGLPTGLMFAIEISFFFVLALELGHIGVTLLAASQVAIQYMSLFVTILFAIAQAITVRVSNRLGAKQPIDAHNAVYSGLFISFSIMSILALIAFIYPAILVGVDFSTITPKNSGVVTDAIAYLKIAVLFLLLESIRISLFGALRGHKATPVTLLSSFLSFWCIAIPMGNVLAYGFGLGGIGFWYGMLFGGVFGALFLWWCYDRRIRHMCLSGVGAG